MTRTVYFTSEPVTIGSQEWRVIVTDSAFGGRRHVYQFKAIGDLPIWTDHTRWPNFDFSAQSMGLPLSLARLYEANRPAITEAIVNWRISA